LMVLGFAAVWIYRFRSSDVYRWLRPNPLRASEESRSLVSPVDEIVSPEVNLTLLRLRGKERLAPAREELPQEPEVPVLSAEEELAAADLPLVEENDTEERAEGEDEGEEPPAFVEVEDAAAADRGESRGGGEVPEKGAPPVVEEPPPAFEEITYKIGENENLWKIAQKFLGAGHRYREIVELNKDTLGGQKSNNVPVGTVIRIRRPVPKEGLKVPPPQVDISVEGRSAHGSPSQNVTRHTVKRNENLKRIAKQYYPGNTEGWRTIFEANRDRLRSPDTVEEGQVLLIPAPKNGSAIR